MLMKWLVRRWMIHYWGKRHEVFDPDCGACVAWISHDLIFDVNDDDDYVSVRVNMFMSKKIEHEEYIEWEEDKES